MNWLRAIGYGVTLFAISFVLGSIVMFGLKLSGIGMSIIMLIAMTVVLWLLAQQYKIRSRDEGIQVGLVWLVVDALLEYYVIVRIFSQGDASKLYSWSVILGYALIVIIPALYGNMKKA
jgi:hypothetical protein